MKRKNTIGRSDTTIIFVIAGVVMVLVIGIFIFFSSKGGGLSTAVLGESIADQGRTHIALNASHDTYNSNPPTSGPHYAQPAQGGVHAEPVADETLVHNLEHGYVWISYSPDKLDKASIDKLESLVRSYPKTILTPRPQNDNPIVLASWGRLLRLATLDEAQARSFIENNRFKAPEPNAP